MSLHVVILAAGKGSRLGTLGAETPKWLLDVGGRTIADRQLEGLERAADRIASVRVVTGHAADAIDGYLDGRAGLPVEPLFNPEYATLNNWYSVLLALEAIEDPEAAVVLMNGDLFVQPDAIAAFVADCADTDAEALIAVDLARRLTDESMKVAVRPDGTLERIGKRDVRDPRGEYIGMLMASGSVLAEWRAALSRFVGRPEAVDEWYEGAIDRMAAAGAAWTVWSMPSGAWVEIDDDGDLAAAVEMAPS